MGDPVDMTLPTPTTAWFQEQARSLSSSKSEDAIGAMAWNLSVAFRRWSDAQEVAWNTRAPTPPPVPAITREELVGIIRPWIEAAMDSAIPEPWEVAANCTNGAADAILARLENLK